MDCDLDELQATTAAAAACVAALANLDTALSERVGPGGIAGWAALSTLAQKISNFLKTTLGRRSPAAGGQRSLRGSSRSAARSRSADRGWLRSS